MKTIEVVAAIIHDNGKILATQRGYGEFKLAVGEACADGLAPIQAEYHRLMADRAYLEGLLRENAEKASYIARRTLSKVYRKIGFLAV